MTYDASSTIHATSAALTISKTQIWSGRIISAFVILFFVMDGVMKLFKPAVVVKATAEILGFPESSIRGIGVALLVCTALYSFPRTSVIGAILLTGFLGGAIASQVRINASLFNVIFPAASAALAWVGLWLRDARLRPTVW